MQNDNSCTEEEIAYGEQMNYAVTQEGRLYRMNNIAGGDVVIWDNI